MSEEIRVDSGSIESLSSALLAASGNFDTQSIASTDVVTTIPANPDAQAAFESAMDAHVVFSIALAASARQISTLRSEFTAVDHSIATGITPMLY